MESFIKSAFIVSVSTAVMSVLIAIPIFLALWFFGTWDVAQRYTLSAAVGLCLFISFFLPKQEGEGTGRNVFIGLALLGTLVYAIGFTGPKVQSVNVVSSTPRAAKPKELSCYDIGLQYGSAASRGLKGQAVANDVLIPERCRGDKMTNLGIKNAMKYQ